MSKRLLIASCLFTVSLTITACGGGVDEPLDPCPTGSCTLAPRTIVKWTFNAYPDRGFPMDSCNDFGAKRVQVDLVDAYGFATSGQDDCGVAQSVFQGLEPGADYQVYVMPLDVDGNPLLSAPATGTVKAGTEGNNTETTVNVPWTAWPGQYSGTFLFRISWGGLSCESTADIRQQRLTLTAGGVVQNITTDDGQMLNGMDMKPCKRLTDNFPQSALNVPFGPATLFIEGFDVANQMRFSKQFDTFVGAGITNPTLTFDVPMM